MELLETALLLVIAHGIADFTLQPAAMVAGKNRHNEVHKQADRDFPAWYYWMTAHSLNHGFAVYLVTGSFTFCIIESTLHWIFDYLKCEGRINFHQDQALHLGCKVGYCFFL